MHLGVHICCDKADFDDTRSQCSRTPEYTGACNLRPIVRSIEAFSGSHTVDHTTLWFAHYRASSSCMAKQPPGPPEVAGGQRSSANALLTACDPPKERGLRIPIFGRLTLDRRLVRSSGKPHDVGQPHPGLRGNVSLRSGDPLSGVLMWEAGPLSIRRLFMCVRPVRIDVLPVQPGAGADFRCSGACDHVRIPATEQQSTRTRINTSLGCKAHSLPGQSVDCRFPREYHLCKRATCTFVGRILESRRT